jgi:hypothetical protein
MGEERKVYKVLVGKPEGKRPPGRPRRRWEDGIRMDLREICLGGGCGLDSTVSGQGPVAGCCECGDEPSGSCATELILVGCSKSAACQDSSEYVTVLRDGLLFKVYPQSKRKTLVSSEKGKVNIAKVFYAVFNDALSVTSTVKTQMKELQVNDEL